MKTQRIGRPWHGAALLLCALLLTACGNLRLHSEVRDKQGAAAKEAWSAVDLTALIATERANLKKLLDAELDAQDRLAAGVRDNELRAMLGAATLREGLVNKVMTRLDGIGESANRVSESRQRLASYITRRGNFAEQEEVFKAERLVMPSCQSLSDGALPPVIKKWRESAPSKSREFVDGAVRQLRSLCRLKPEPDFVTDVVEGFVKGSVAGAISEYKRDRQQLNTAVNKANELKSNYAVALADYNKAVSAANVKGDTTDSVKALVQKLDRAVEELKAAGGPYVEQFLSQERLNALDDFFKAVTDAKADGTVPPGTGRAATAFILLPGLLDDARESLAQAKKPLALPLMIRRDHEQLRLEAASREIAAWEARVGLSRQIVETLYEQAVQLWLASRELHENGVKALHGRRLIDAFNDASEDNKELLYTAAARYMDVINRLTARRYKLEYQRIATSHELSLAYAEINIKQWQALIGASVEQMAAYGAGGIKSENVAALVNSIGVFWIARGVNKK